MSEEVLDCLNVISSKTIHSRAALIRKAVWEFIKKRDPKKYKELVKKLIESEFPEYYK